MYRRNQHLPKATDCWAPQNPCFGETEEREGLAFEQHIVITLHVQPPRSLATTLHMASPTHLQFSSAEVLVPVLSPFVPHIQHQQLRWAKALKARGRRGHYCKREMGLLTEMHRWHGHLRKEPGAPELDRKQSQVKKHKVFFQKMIGWGMRSKSSCEHLQPSKVCTRPHKPHWPLPGPQKPQEPLQVSLIYLQVLKL